MLEFLRSASSLRSLLFDSFPINLLSPASSPSHHHHNTSSNTNERDLYWDRDLAFDSYENDIVVEEKLPSQQQIETTTTLINYSAFDSYDWAFSFRESTKSDDKLIFEVSVERLPKDCEAHYYPSQPPVTNEMTLLHGEHAYPSGNRKASVIETAELISEEEQNMILAAIIASKENDFDQQIPGHCRDELEHAAFIAAMEESREMSERQAVVAAPAPKSKASTPTREAPTPSAFTASPTTPRSLKRSDSDIPWTSGPGTRVQGESSEQQKFRELLQFHAIAAASIANASARSGMSNITGGGGSDYDWIGEEK